MPPASARLMLTLAARGFLSRNPCGALRRMIVGSRGTSLDNSARAFLTVFVPHAGATVKFSG